MILSSPPPDKGDDGRKRKASAAADQPSSRSPQKRPRQDRAHDGSPQPSDPPPEPFARTDSQPRSLSATQEDKQRGKRLFGGLLNTLGRTTVDAQQKRRLEIERRLQDKMLQQNAEDDKKMAEERASRNKARIEKQQHFDEQVMRSRHGKQLKLARFLRTRSLPQIYYLPRKPTPGEKRTLEEQIREVKEAVAKDVDNFRRHGELDDRQQSTPPETLPSNTEQPAIIDQTLAPASPPAQLPTLPPAEADDDAGQLAETSHHHDPHDDSGDILVEAEEDMSPTCTALLLSRLQANDSAAVSLPATGSPSVTTATIDE